jgi:hypothetical protein
MSYGIAGGSPILLSWYWLLAAASIWVLVFSCWLLGHLA